VTGFTTSASSARSDDPSSVLDGRTWLLPINLWGRLAGFHHQVPTGIEPCFAISGQYVAAEVRLTVGSLELQEEAFRQPLKSSFGPVISSEIASATTACPRPAASCSFQRSIRAFASARAALSAA
jgi:hypothetical protein